MSPAARSHHDPRLHAGVSSTEFRRSSGDCTGLRVGCRQRGRCASRLDLRVFRTGARGMVHARSRWRPGASGVGGARGAGRGAVLGRPARPVRLATVTRAEHGFCLAEQRGAFTKDDFIARHARAPAARACVFLDDSGVTAGA